MSIPNNLLGVRFVHGLVLFVTNDRNLLVLCQLSLSPIQDGVDVQNAEVHVKELEKSHDLITSRTRAHSR